MCLPLPELGRAVHLGRAFQSAFQRRRVLLEDFLARVARDAFGEPLLTALALVVQRYRRGVSLQTGCGSMKLFQAVTIQGCGVITGGVGDFWSGDGRTVPHALVFAAPRHRMQNDSLSQNLRVWLRARLHGRWDICLTLRGPTRRSSVHHRNEAAMVEACCPEPWECLGAAVVIARHAAGVSICQENPETPQQENPEAPQQGPVATPGGPILSAGGNAVEYPQANPGSSLQVPEANLGSAIQESPAILPRPPRWKGSKALRRVSVEPLGPDVEAVPDDVMDLGVTTALTLASRFQVPCCWVKIAPVVCIRACQTSQYCGKHVLPR
jgi:hypothetical protein